MSDELYWDNYFDLFTTPGWKQFVDESQENFNYIDISDCSNWDQYLIRRTEKLMLDKIVRFEELIRKQYEYKKEEDKFTEVDLSTYSD